MFAIALLASGQSSTITGTYAGQYVMQVGVYSMLMQDIQSRTLKISVYLAIRFPFCLKLQGFLQLKYSPWIRNMLTRCVAIVPSLIVSLIAGPSGAGKLIIVSSVGVLRYL